MVEWRVVCPFLDAEGRRVRFCFGIHNPSDCIVDNTVYLKILCFVLN